MPEAGRVEGLELGGCEIVTSSAVGDGATLDLFASRADLAAGRALAHVRYEAATFSIPPGTAAEASSVEASGFGFTASGLVATSSIGPWVKPLHRLAGGMITPSTDTRVALVGIDRDVARVRLERIPFVDLASLPIEEAVRCSDLSASAPDALPLPAGKEVTLTPPLELLASPDAAPGSGLPLVSPRASLASFGPALELERRGRLVHVVIGQRAGNLGGWVMASAVRSLPSGVTGTGAELGHRAAATVGLDTHKGYTCIGPVRVAALARGSNEPVWLGEVRPGAPFGKGALAPPALGWSSIALSGVRAEILLARDVDLSSCTYEAPGL